MSRSAIEKWRKGEADPSLANVIAIAEATGVDFAWLATGDTRNIRMTLEELQHAIEDRSLVNVERYDTALAPGTGNVRERAKFRDLVPFNTSYINGSLRRGPDRLIMFEVRGDTMDPTVCDRDLVMVDSADTALATGIWAIEIENAVAIRRLNPTHQGIEVICDNPIYGRQLIGHDSPDAVRLVGRVVWIARVISRAPAAPDHLEAAPLDPAQSVPSGAQISGAPRSFRPELGSLPHALKRLPRKRISPAKPRGGSSRSDDPPTEPRNPKSS